MNYRERLRNRKRPVADVRLAALQAVTERLLRNRSIKIIYCLVLYISDLATAILRLYEIKPKPYSCRLDQVYSNSNSAEDRSDPYS